MQTDSALRSTRDLIGAEKASPGKVDTGARDHQGDRRGPAGHTGEPGDYTATLRTVNGKAPAAPVKIGRLQIGGIALQDVPAYISETTELNLLGMSFLSRLKFTHERNKLLLEQ